MLAILPTPTAEFDNFNGLSLPLPSEITFKSPESDELLPTFSMLGYVAPGVSPVNEVPILVPSIRYQVPLIYY